MKSLPLIAFAAATICTGAAIGAYVWVGRDLDADVLLTAAEELDRTHQIPGPDAKMIPPGPHGAPGRGAYGSHAQSAHVPVAAWRIGIPRHDNPESLETQDHAEIPFARSERRPVSNVGSSAHRVGRFSALDSASGDQANRSAQQTSFVYRTAASALNGKARNETAPSDSPSAPEPVHTLAVTPEPSLAVASGKATAPTPVGTDVGPSTPSPIVPSNQSTPRRPWPRGNFTPEEERYRAQYGWQTFADEIFHQVTAPE